jgi:hypothetical protein
VLQLKNKYGKVAIELSSVRAESDAIVIKGEALGAMPIAVNVTADDMWEVRQFLTWSVIRRVPVMFVQGWWRSRKVSHQPERMEESE